MIYSLFICNTISICPDSDSEKHAYTFWNASETPSQTPSQLRSTSWVAATHWPFAGTSWLSALLALKNTRLPFETHVKPRAEPRAALESRKSLARYCWPDSNSFYIVISETTHSWGKWLILAGGECFRICLPYHEILRFNFFTELRPFKVKKVDAKFCTFSHSCVLFLP